MKKLISLLFIILLLTGCSSNKVEQVDTFNQETIIVEYRNDYYTFEEGYYYTYKFTVGDSDNTFKHNRHTWFYSNEKWEIDDVVIVTEVEGELHFLKIGNLNYEEGT